MCQSFVVICVILAEFQLIVAAAFNIKRYIKNIGFSTNKVHKCFYALNPRSHGVLLVFQVELGKGCT